MDNIYRIYTDDPASLTDAQRLDFARRYYADDAADGWENGWRKMLSTLDDVDPHVAALVAAEWLIKGPEAERVLAFGHSDLIDTEARIISLFGGAQVTAADVAADVAARYRFWVSGGVLLTALRRAAQHRIYAQSTPEGCAAAFAQMREVAEQVIAMTLAGASKEAVMTRLAELAEGL